MSKKQDVEKWLSESPLPEEILTKRKNGRDVQFIPIRIIEDKLTFLDTHWSTSNFKFFVDNETFGGSVELLVEFNEKTKSVCGAFTARISDYNPNENLQATALSEATKNAAKKLGNTFGRLLNPEYDEAPENQNGHDRLKPKADLRIRELHKSAQENGDFRKVKQLEDGYDFSIG